MLINYQENEMGLGGISIWQLLIVLVIILLLVGPKRLKSLGSEMGNFLKNFRKAVDDKEENQNESDK
tara:strand:- start:37 stop:237 length:201 start_codon:yes stop_codon:yes gene_type:complete